MRRAYFVAWALLLAVVLFGCGHSILKQINATGSHLNKASAYVDAAKKIEPPAQTPILDEASKEIDLAIKTDDDKSKALISLKDDYTKLRNDTFVVAALWVKRFFWTLVIGYPILMVLLGVLGGFPGLGAGWVGTIVRWLCNLLPAANISTGIARRINSGTWLVDR